MTVRQFHPVEPLRQDAAIVAKIIMDRFPGIQSVVDFGCNDGQTLAAFQALGVEDLHGVDGAGMREHLRYEGEFTEWDLTTPLSINEDVDGARKFDLAVCTEVGEHLPPEAAITLLDTLTRHSDLILFSAATPGQGGTGHLNERLFSWWEVRFAAFGYVNDITIRQALPDQVSWWVRKNLAIFQRVR